MNQNWIYIHFTCTGFEPASGGVSDSGSDSSEGHAGLCRLLHPERKAVRCGRGAQNPTGGLKSTRSNVQHGSKSISHYCPQVISKLGLDSLGSFVPKERIIE